MKTALLFLAVALGLNAQTVTLTGNTRIFEGSSAWSALHTSGLPGANSYAKITAPEPGTLAYWNGSRASISIGVKPEGRVLIYNLSTQAILIEAKGLPVGTHEISASVQNLAGEELGAAKYTVTVEPLPRKTIAALEKWEAAMLLYGKRVCNPTEDFGTFGYEGTPWFYDGARVFFQVADYTGDKSFEACAYNIASQYADYAIKVNGAMAGWRVFTRGLRMAYERSGDPKYKQAIILLSKNSNASVNAGAYGTSRSRETAYALNSYIDAMKVGEPEHPLMKVAVEYILWHFNSIYVTGDYQIHQPFFQGLESEALIDYYELKHDPRVLPTLRLFLDWIWEKGWNHTTNELVYNPDPPGPRCDAKTGGCLNTGTELINLIVPAFAFYARETEDAEIQRRGDVLFAHAFDVMPWGGKQYSQFYKWSFDFAKWRYDRTSSQN